MRVLPFLLAVGLVGSPVRAQAPVPAQRGAGTDTVALTLGDMVRRALATHPSLVSAEAHLAGAEAGVGEASGARLPQVSADGQLVRFQEPMVVAPLHGFDPRVPPAFDRSLVQGNVTAGYTLFDGGARGARIDRARGLAAVASADADAARMMLVSEVARAYLDVRSAREVAEAQAMEVVALAEEHGRAERLYREGRAARVAVLRAQAALSRARADSLSDAMQVEVAERSLARLAAVDAADVAGATLAGVGWRGVQPAREVVLQRALASNPDLARVRARQAAATAARAEARSLWLPRLQLTGRFADYGSLGGSFQGEWQGGAQISYPLFTGGSRSGTIERADAEARAARADARVVELRIGDGVDRALAAASAAAARVEALTSAVAQSEEVARIELLALEAGAGVQTDYLTAQADLFRTRAALTEARYAEISARIEIARIEGELSAAWLAENVEAGS